MGWDFTNKLPCKDYSDLTEFIREEYEDSGEIVAISQHGRTEVYAAFKCPHVDDALGERRVLGIVFLIEDQGRNIGYKSISEDMGPYYFNASAEVLDALSEPAPNGWATKWRRKCRKNLSS